MQLLYKAVIHLDPRAKKNDHRIGGRGQRCPMCGKFRQQFIRNGHTSSAYALQATAQLGPDRPPAPIDRPVRLVYRMYTQTWHRKDDLNLYEAMDDILVCAKILADDNRKIIRSRDGSRVLYDKHDPRTEIYIYTYEEEEDHEFRRTDFYS